MNKRTTSITAFFLGLCVLVGCSTRQAVRVAAPDRLEVDPLMSSEFAALGPAKIDPNATPEEINRAQWLRRRQLVAKADSLVIQGKHLYNSKSYVEASDRFVVAEQLYEEASASGDLVQKKLAAVRRYLDYAYTQHANSLLVYAEEAIDFARDGLDVRHLDVAQAKISEAMKYDVTQAKRIKKLEAKIRQLRFQIEIDLKTKPEYILKQLGDLENELRRKIVERRREWALAKAGKLRPTVVQGKEMEIQVAIRVYITKREWAQRQFGRKLINACYPEFVRVDDDPSSGWTIRKEEPALPAELTAAEMRKLDDIRRRASVYVRGAKICELVGDHSAAGRKYSLAAHLYGLLPNATDNQVNMSRQAAIQRQLATSPTIKPPLPHLQVAAAAGVPAAVAANVGTGTDEIWIVAREREALAANVPFTPRPDLVGVSPDNGELVPLPLERTDVKARISGWIANVDVKQQYDNPFDSAIEAVYIFPLPHDAAVTDFVVTIGNRSIRGIIREREEAEAIYKAAKEQGYAASLLTERRPNVFRQKIANLAPNHQINVQIKYFNTLQYKNGAFEFVFPMVAGPGPGDGDELSPNYLAPGTRSGHKIALNVDIDTALPIGAIESSTHDITCNRRGVHSAAVRLNPHDSIPNRDFVLRYSIPAKALNSGIAVHHGKDHDTFALLVVPPEFETPLQEREIVFVVDCSGSMRGAPLETMKAAIRHALSNLNSGDTFRIVPCSEDAIGFGHKPMTATKENVALGLRYLDKLTSGGDTMMLNGIKSALSMPVDEKRLRIVVVMTDGYIGNEAEILATARKQLGTARIFSFGIGNAVNRHFIHALAADGVGQAAVITTGEKPAKVLDAFLMQTARSPLAQIEVDWHGMQVSDVYPQRIGDILGNRPLLITGRCTGPIPKDISLMGITATGSEKITVPVTAVETDNEAVRRIWARHKIAEMERQTAASCKADGRRDLVEFARAESVMCMYTAFLTVDALTRIAPTGKASVRQLVPDSRK